MSSTRQKLSLKLFVLLVCNTTGNDKFLWINCENEPITHAVRCCFGFTCDTKYMQTSRLLIIKLSSF